MKNNMNLMVKNKLISAFISMHDSRHVQVAAKALETAVFGAYYNVIINLKDIKDASFRAAVSIRKHSTTTVNLGQGSHTAF